MMSLHKLTAGDGYTYLTRQVAAADTTERGVSSLADYYSAKGETPGQWLGAGLDGLSGVEAGTQVGEEQMKALFGEGRHPNAAAIEQDKIAELTADGASAEVAAKKAMAATRLGNPYRIYEGASEFQKAVAQAFSDHNVARGRKWNTSIDAEIRAGIRTKIATEMFTEQFGRGPLDERELSAFVAKNSRKPTTAVAGFDLTFSPVKSVSTLHALAPREMADRIEAAHHKAVRDALDYLESNAVYTRSGANGVAQLDVEGLIGAAFTHRDSRAGDPDLHTHVAISNKVKVRGEDRWLALDGAPLYRANVAASELYNTHLETYLREDLGVEFADRPGADPRKRAVREIVGVDDALMKRWSNRREAIEARRSELAAQFQLDHGREPSPVEALALAQQATLETREAKHEPRSAAEQRAAWRREAEEVLGSTRSISDMVAAATTPRRRDRTKLTKAFVEQAALTAVQTTAESRSRWQETHIRAEAERIVRSANLVPADAGKAVDRIVAAALGHRISVPLGAPERFATPAPLQRADGTSVYSRAGTQLYTSTEILEAEERIITAAGLNDGRTVSAREVDMALLEQAANGFELNTGQAQLVRDLATSGSRVQLALAPAGTGKTSAMAVFARAIEAEGGHVIGLAPTAAAAKVLGKDLGAVADTMHKLAHTVEEIAAVQRGERSFADVPEWVEAIDERTFVIIDEAGMAATTDLDAVISYVISKGGSVRLIGDDQQLASVASGGVLRDIHVTHGSSTLTDVVRFSYTNGEPNHTEGRASLALRAGDPAAIGFYIDNARITVGDTASAEDLAYEAWAKDIAAGSDSVMLAPTRDLVFSLNERARADRLAAAAQERDPLDPANEDLDREITLGDGSQASAGDLVVTRQNKRRFVLSRTDFVRNGDRWTVLSANRNGSLSVKHLVTGRTITLPARYAREHVALGYARTIHAAQGLTADTCHTVGTGGETRQLAYVALTRGRHGNHLYLGTAHDGDEHGIITPDGLIPPTAVDYLERVLARDGSQESANTALRNLDDPTRNLGHSADAFDDAVGSAAEHLLGREAVAALDAAAEELLPGLTDQSAYPVLRKHLARLAVDGIDAAQRLEQAAGSRELDTALDVAAVLDWRLDPSGNHSTGRGPLPWLPTIPKALLEHPTWNTYLTNRAEHVTENADGVRAAAADYTRENAPVWARPFLQADPTLLADLAVFRYAHSVEDIDLRPTGPDLFAAADRRAQEKLNGRVQSAVGDVNTAARAWRGFAEQLEPRLLQDPYWPVLAEQFAAAHRAGVDVHTIARTAAHTPLPDDMPAAALWWRVSAELAPAIDAAEDSLLDPRWRTDLDAAVGADLAAAAAADTGWSALVRAVDAADPLGATPAELLEVATALIVEGQDGQPLRPDDAASALRSRVRALVAETTEHRQLPAVEHEDDLTAEAEAASRSGVGLELSEAPADFDYSLFTSVEDSAAADRTAKDPYAGSGEIVLDGDIPLPDEPDFYYDSDDVPPPPEPDDYFGGENPFPPDEQYLPIPQEWTAEWSAESGVDVSEDDEPVVVIAPDRYPDLSPAERLDALRGDLAAAEAARIELHVAVFSDSGPHMTASDPILTDLRARRDELRPLHVDALDAHEHWQDAAATENEYAAEVARLRTELAAARAQHTEADAPDGAAISEADTQIFSEADTQIFDLRSQLELAEMSATWAQGLTQSAHQEYLTAQTQLEELAGGRQNIVTAVDVDFAEQTAREFDIAALDEARAQVREIRTQLTRAEHAAAADIAERWNTEYLDGTPGPTPDTGPAGGTAVAVLDRAPAIATENVRTLSTADLQSRRLAAESSIERANAAAAAAKADLLRAALTIDSAAVADAETRLAETETALTAYTDTVERADTELERRSALTTAERDVEALARKKFQKLPALPDSAPAPVRAPAAPLPTPPESPAPAAEQPTENPLRPIPDKDLAARIRTATMRRTAAAAAAARELASAEAAASRPTVHQVRAEHAELRRIAPSIKAAADAVRAAKAATREHEKALEALVEARGARASVGRLSPRRRQLDDEIAAAEAAVQQALTTRGQARREREELFGAAPHPQTWKATMDRVSDTDALRAELDAALATDSEAETTARERLAAAEADIAAADTTIETYQSERTRRAELTPEQREQEAAVRREAAPVRKTTQPGRDPEPGRRPDRDRDRGPGL
ncbi:MobF family relaxase [Rhodococcus erythropolis]|jgi:conjugative relaxase-like TrwC/TraI family protein|uniref:MobF family relaxase n=1 Tax=Rhodococcus erythropolis TaxID=1833 RepID=UPI0022B3BFE5|nr:MobF family relaxase [Rhodococcus erythropolis]MCZ4645094.1 relaxase domain-containing protein [Rhodococcus erythropolis]